MDEQVVAPDGALVIVAVGNIGLRRGLDRIRGARILECGIGDGAQAFTRVQMHAFPGSRLAQDFWSEGDARAGRPVDLDKPAYQELLRKSGDVCSTTLVASRSVATPFVGAFAGSVLVWLAATGSLQDAWNFDLNCLLSRRQVPAERRDRTTSPPLCVWSWRPSLSSGRRQSLPPCCGPSNAW